MTKLKLKNYDTRNKKNEIVKLEEKQKRPVFKKGQSVKQSGLHGYQPYFS